MRKWKTSLLAPALFLFIASPVAAEDSESPSSRETDHLSIRWVEGVSAEAVEAVAKQGEVFYDAIATLLGEELPRRIPILLGGPAESPDRTQRSHPHVDSFGRIQLFRYGGRDVSYLSPLAHEMVHVFRFKRRRQADWFFEEGFAEFVALTVDSSLSGFPWYDTPVEIAAGQWIASDADLPLEKLREEHRALNLPCKAQSYALRSSFFRYLGNEYGKEAILEMAGKESAGDLADYRSILKKDFSELESEWRAWLLATYRSIDNVEVLAKRYREETPIQYMPVCN